MDLALRRTLMWSLAGVALAALLAAVIVTALAPDNALTWLVAALIVLAGALVGEVVLLVLNDDTAAHPPRHSRSAAAAANAAASAGGVGGARQTGRPRASLGPAAGKGDDLLLRCSECSKTFTAFDDGHRPLATLCPHCGQRGVIDAPTA